MTTLRRKYSITQLRIKGLESLNGCQFRVIVAGAAGTVISDPCTLTVDTQTESTLQSIDGQIVQVALGKEEAEKAEFKVIHFEENGPVVMESRTEVGTETDEMSSISFETDSSGSHT